MGGRANARSAHSESQMKYYSYKELLLNIIQRYIDSIDEISINYINSSYINPLEFLDELYTIQVLIATQKDVPQYNFELVLSNYPCLLEFLHKEIREKINETGSSK